MKIKEGFILKKIAEDHIIVPIGSNLVNFNSMMTLNETGVFLWQQLQTDTTTDELVKAMCAEFDIDQATASEDIIEFVKTLKENNLIDL